MNMIDERVVRIRHPLAESQRPVAQRRIPFLTNQLEHRVLGYLHARVGLRKDRLLELAAHEDDHRDRKEQQRGGSGERNSRDDRGSNDTWAAHTLPGARRVAFAPIRLCWLGSQRNNTGM